jgi:hypothetical protein
MKDFKYTTIFSSVIRPLVSEEKDKYLAMASSLDVKNFVPDVDTDKEIDLLPIAFNACVANRVNKNCDVVDTKTAVEMYKSFINKPINVEHNRQRVVGTILTAGFSEFGTDKLLQEQDIRERSGPFNITLGGVIWKVVNSELTDIIEESNDPTSEHYMKISASWELGFSDYNLVLLDKNQKNIEGGIEIDDEKEVDSLKENLKIFGGTGKTDSGKYVYRKVINNVLPLGIGLTETPAADVVGVRVKDSPQVKAKLEKDAKPKPVENEKIKENNISQSDEKNVNTEKRVIMKITNIKDITDDNMKELSASTISDFVEQELKEASEKFAAEKKAMEESLETAMKQAKERDESSKATEEELDKVKSALTTLEQERTEKEAEETFNLRMASLDETYDLTDEDREVIASDIKEMDKAAFEGYQKKVSVLLRDKNKQVIEAAQKVAEEKAETKKAKTAEEVEADESAENKAEEAEGTIEEALDTAEVDASEVPVSITIEEPNVYNKYKKAFSIENWIK